MPYINVVRRVYKVDAQQKALVQAENIESRYDSDILILLTYTRIKAYISAYKHACTHTHLYTIKSTQGTCTLTQGMSQASERFMHVRASEPARSSVPGNVCVCVCE